MGLFDVLKKKPQKLAAKLVSTKKEQTELEALAKYHDPLKAWLDLSDSGNLMIRVGKNSNHTIGKLPAAVTKDLEKKYGTKNGLSCNLIIGEDYKVEKDGDLLACTVQITVEA